MLVLTRRRNESIVIGDNVEISIVDIRGNRVRLGICAPRDVSVHRKEIYELIRSQKTGTQTEGNVQIRPRGGPAVPAKCPTWP